MDLRLHLHLHLPLVLQMAGYAAGQTYYAAGQTGVCTQNSILTCKYDPSTTHHIYISNIRNFT